MFRLIVILVGIAFLIACGGGSQGPKSSPLGSDVQLDDGTGDLATCQGEQALDEGQVAIVRELAADTDGVQLVCAGVTLLDEPFVKIHVVANQKTGAGVEPFEGEETFELVRVDGGWNKRGKYGLNLSPTAKQAQMNAEEGRKTQQAYWAEMTATEEAAEMATESRELALARAAVNQVTLSNPRLVLTEYPETPFSFTFDVKSTPVEEMIEFDAEFIVVLGNGQEITLLAPSERGSCWSYTMLLVAPEYPEADWSVCPESEVGYQDQGARLVKARLIFGEGEVPGPWVSP